MRRLLAILTVLVACLFGLPATAQAAQAAPMPIGGGSVLSTLGGARCTAGFAATNADAGYLIAAPAARAATSTSAACSSARAPRAPDTRSSR